MPKGYWIAHITVHDLAAYEPYRQVVAAVLLDHGASFVVRAGAQTVVEGRLRPRCIVVAFPSLQAAMDCYHSPAYQAAKKLRSGASEGDVCIVEGYDG
jgi:uncharacterized protein (DUF1330 family)